MEELEPGPPRPKAPYHPWVADCPKRAMFNGHPVCGCGELPTNMTDAMRREAAIRKDERSMITKDAAGHVVKRGDEVRFEDGRIARILKVKSEGLDVVYRKACDVHPGYWTYYRLSWFFHHLWRHWIGF